MQGWFLKLTAAQQKYQANSTTGSMQQNKRYEWEQIPVFKKRDANIVDFHCIFRLTVHTQCADILTYSVIAQSILPHAGN